MLQDAAFPPIAHISTPAGSQADMKLATVVSVPCSALLDLDFLL